MLPLTQAQWSLSGREAGMIQAAFHLGYLTSLFIVGFLADHFGAGVVSPVVFGWALVMTWRLRK